MSHRFTRYWIFLSLFISYFGLYSQSQTVSNPNKLSKNVVQSIRDYYQIAYGIGSYIEETSNDTTLDIDYLDNDTAIGMPLIMAVSIPLIEIPGETRILHGDLNNDNTYDLVVNVHTEFGNTGRDNIFVFLNIYGEFKLVSFLDDDSLTGCSGYFNAKRIEKNYIIGESACYGPKDARCCPSIFNETKVLLKNNKLIFVSTKRINK
jgi:hypothetical protein